MEGHEAPSLEGRRDWARRPETPAAGVLAPSILLHALARQREPGLGGREAGNVFYSSRVSVFRDQAPAQKGSPQARRMTAKTQDSTLEKGHGFRHLPPSRCDYLNAIEIALLCMFVPEKSFTSPQTRHISFLVALPQGAKRNASLIAMTFLGTMAWGLPGNRIWGCGGHLFPEARRCGCGERHSLWDQTPVLVLNRLLGGDDVLTSC